MGWGVAAMADVSRVERTPLARRDLPRSTYDALLRGESLNPDKIALRFFLQGDAYEDQVFYTYKDLIGLVNQTANMFNDLGIGREDVVSMILPNIPQAFFTLWGGEAAGIANPIDPLLEPQVMAAIMNAAGTKVLVTLAPFPATDLWERVAAAADQVPTLKTILQVDLTYYLPTLQRLATRYVNFRTGKGRAVKADVFDFGKTSYRYPAEKLVNDRAISPNHIASYLHTGNDSGKPLLARHSHLNEVYNAWAAAQYIDLPAEIVQFCGQPLHAAAGYILSGMMPFMHGACVVLGTTQGFSDDVIAGFWSIVEHYKINLFDGNTAVLDALLDVPLDEQDISSLELVLCRAAHLPESTRRRFEEKTRARLIAGYGLDEATCISSLNPPYGERRGGSIGFRLPYQQMKAIQLDENMAYVRDCRDDEVGTVVVRGPNVFPGYVEEAHNKGVLIDAGEGKAPWLKTGEMGRRDAQGYFWLEGPART